MNSSQENNWKVEQTSLLEGLVNQYFITHNQNRLSYGDFLENLIRDAEFRIFYNNILANSPFKAFFWENPPVKAENLDRIYEFILIKSTALERIQADRQTFEAYFKSDQNVVDFTNLGGDAHLIVPCPVNEAGDYAHLAQFVRNAPLTQIHEFWKRTAEKYLEAIQTGKRWLSTSGLGVYWLHVRIDTRPKYYQHRNYMI